MPCRSTVPAFWRTPRPPRTPRGPARDALRNAARGEVLAEQTRRAARTSVADDYGREPRIAALRGRGSAARRGSGALGLDHTSPEAGRVRGAPRLGARDPAPADLERVGPGAPRPRPAATRPCTPRKWMPSPPSRSAAPSSQPDPASWWPPAPRATRLPRAGGCRRAAGWLGTSGDHSPRGPTMHCSRRRDAAPPPHPCEFVTPEKHHPCEFVTRSRHPRTTPKPTAETFGSDGAERGPADARVRNATRGAWRCRPSRSCSRSPWRTLISPRRLAVELAGTVIQGRVQLRPRLLQPRRDAEPLAVPLLRARGAVVSLRSGLFSIGQEGQYALGGLARRPSSASHSPAPAGVLLSCASQSRRSSIPVRALNELIITIVLNAMAGLLSTSSRATRSAPNRGPSATPR